MGAATGTTDFDPDDPTGHSSLGIIRLGPVQGPEARLGEGATSNFLPYRWYMDHGSSPSGKRL